MKPRVDWDAQPLGKERDVVIAARVGVTSTSVRNARVVRGIPACERAPAGRPRRGSKARSITLASLVTDKAVRDAELAHLRRERDALQDRLAPIHVMIETLERLGDER